MYYRHELDYNYPERSDEHMIDVKHIKDLNLDEDYPYLLMNRFSYKCLRSFYWLALNLVAFPLVRITHGLRVYGRENLKKHKALLQNGVITIANHVFMWDFICVLKAMRPHLAYFPAWKTNLEGPNRHLIRMSGGIPVPTNSLRSMIKFNRAVEEVLDRRKWFHVYPEGSMWFYYPDVRPFKNAVFKYAVKYDMPVLPIAMTFRPRKGITKLFTKKPQVDIHVGEPLLPDKQLSRNDAVDKLHKEAYHVMQVMCGINPGDPTYNTDQRIGNYKKTM